MAEEFGAWSDEHEYEYQFGFNDPIGQVENVSLYQISNNSGNLTWNALAGVTGYEVERTDLFVNDTRVARTTVNSLIDDGTMFNNQTPAPGNAYMYRVRGYRGTPDEV